LECFEYSLAKCKRARYIDDSGLVTWSYEIRGGILRKGCIVKSKLLQVKEGKSELEKGVGLSMMCEVESGSVNIVENLDFCHGGLKEFLQTIIIQRLHKHIVEKLGEEAELESVLG
jgi:hypothetical protein